MQGEKTVLVPEDIGRQAAYMLLEEVQRGGICTLQRPYGSLAHH